MRLVEVDSPPRPRNLLPGMFFLYDGDFCLALRYEMYFNFETNEEYDLMEVNLDKVHPIEVDEIKYSRRSW